MIQGGSFFLLSMFIQQQLCCHHTIVALSECLSHWSYHTMYNESGLMESHSLPVLRHVHVILFQIEVLDITVHSRIQLNMAAVLFWLYSFYKRPNGANLDCICRYQLVLRSMFLTIVNTHLNLLKRAHAVRILG